LKINNSVIHRIGEILWQQDKKREQRKTRYSDRACPTNRKVPLSGLGHEKLALWEAEVSALMLRYWFDFRSTSSRQKSLDINGLGYQGVKAVCATHLTIKIFPTRPS
jgi:hypothetical protein